MKHIEILPQIAPLLSHGWRRTRYCSSFSVWFFCVKSNIVSPTSASAMFDARTRHVTTFRESQVSQMREPLQIKEPSNRCVHAWLNMSISAHRPDSSLQASVYTKRRFHMVSTHAQWTTVWCTVDSPSLECCELFLFLALAPSNSPLYVRRHGCCACNVC